MPAVDPDFPDILQHFELTGHIDGAEAYGSGHINDTWLIRINHFDSRKRYVLQRINADVFPDPLGVMQNIDRIARHVQSLPASTFAETLSDQPLFAPIPSRDGQPCWQDNGGSTWRFWPFIYGASTVDSVTSIAQARTAAKAFGDFQNLLRSLPGPPLVETIAGFHDTVARLGQFQAVLADDPHQRAGACQAEIDLVLEYEQFIHSFFQLVDEGTLPTRIAHNDAKINNVMLRDETGEAACVIDLDTVMPGLSVFDFGDIVRTMTSSGSEDQADSNDIVMRMDWYEAVTDGYLEATREFLTADEIRCLPDAGKVLTFETGLRFLTDYLSGDVYFRTTRQEQNLDRCRTQFALLRSIDSQLDEMRAVTARLVS